MNAAAAHADDDVAGAHVVAADHLVEVDAADRHADEIEAPHDVLELRGLAARNGDAGHVRAVAQPDPDGVEHGGIGVVDGDVVDQRERPRADADHVVDVHGDAIDADGVVFAHHRRDDGLGADAVGAQRDAGAVHLHDVGEISDRQHDAPHAVARPGALHAPHDVAEPFVGFGGVDAEVAVNLLLRETSWRASMGPSSARSQFNRESPYHACHAGCHGRAGCHRPAGQWRVFSRSRRRVTPGMDGIWVALGWCLDGTSR